MFEHPFSIAPKETKRINIPITSKVCRLRYIINATNTIKVFVVDPHGLNNIRNNKSFEPYNDLRIGQDFDEIINFPSQNMYFLVIYNPSDTETVSYNYKIYA